MSSVSPREIFNSLFRVGVKHVTNSPCSLQPSHAERFNVNLRSALIACHSHADTIWDQNISWLQLAFNSAEHEATKAAPYVVLFPFRAGSTLLNRWKINDLLPKKYNKRALKQLWSDVKRNFLKSQVSMAKSKTVTVYLHHLR